MASDDDRILEARSCLGCAHVYLDDLESELNRLAHAGFGPIREHLASAREEITMAQELLANTDGYEG